MLPLAFPSPNVPVRIAPFAPANASLPAAAVPRSQISRLPSHTYATATPFLTEMAIDAAPPVVCPAQTAVIFAAADASAAAPESVEAAGAEAAGPVGDEADTTVEADAAGRDESSVAAELAPKRAAATVAPTSRVNRGVLRFMSSMET